MSKLNRRVWQNNNLTQMTKLCVYQARDCCTLLYSSEAWTTYTRQEKKLNNFHLPCLRRILDISWQDNTTNTEVLVRGHWKAVVNAGMRRGEENRSVHEAVNREKRKQKSSHPAHRPQPTIYICHKCDRDCHARVGLISHSRKC